MRYLFFIFISFPGVIKSQVIDEATFFSMAVLPEYANLDISHTPNFSWIEEYELRMETHDFDLRQQEYTLRISPISGKERRSIQAIYDMINTRPNFDLLDIKCDRLSTINRDWLALFLLQNNLNLLYKMEKILLDKQLVYRRLLAADAISFQKVIELETDLTDISISIHDLKQEVLRISNHYGLQGDSLSFQRFLPISQIETTISESKVGIDMDESQFTYEKEMIQKEMEYEQARSKRWIDFAQLRFNGAPDDPLKDRIHLGVGFRFPTSADRKLKLNELAIEQINLDNEYELRNQERYDELKILYGELKMAISNLGYLNEKVEKEKDRLNELGDQYAQKEGYDPVLLLEIEERYIKNQLAVLDKKEDIYIDYVKLLLLNGQICSGDRLNFLSQN